MKIEYFVYKIENKTVCEPSQDYYSRSGDWWETTIIDKILLERCESEELAEEYMNKINCKGEFFIQKVYVK